MMITISGRSLTISSNPLYYLCNAFNRVEMRDFGSTLIGAVFLDYTTSLIGAVFIAVILLAFFLTYETAVFSDTFFTFCCAAVGFLSMIRYGGIFSKDCGIFCKSMDFNETRLFNKMK